MDKVTKAQVLEEPGAGIALCFRNTQGVLGNSVSTVGEVKSRREIGWSTQEDTKRRVGYCLGKSHPSLGKKN